MKNCNKPLTKEIISFNLKLPNEIPFATGEIVVTIQGYNIDITIPSGTDLTQLIPYVSINGKSISPSRLATRARPSRPP